jgi:hypothetical protein
LGFIKFLLSFVFSVLFTLCALIVAYGLVSSASQEKSGLEVAYAAFAYEWKKSGDALWEECKNFKKQHSPEHQPKTLDELLEESLAEPNCEFNSPIFIDGKNERLDAKLAANLSRDTHYKFMPSSKCPNKETCNPVIYSIEFIVPNVAIVKMSGALFYYEYLTVELGGNAYVLNMRGFII